MSRPKELNFFVTELNWPLGRDWYAGHFDPSAPVRGESSPHYTNRPAFAGVSQRMREGALLVCNPIIPEWLQTILSRLFSIFSPIAIPTVRKIHASKVQGRTQRAHAASTRASISAATANEKEMDRPT